MRIDTADEDSFLQKLIETSQIYIDSCVGTDYKNNEKKVQLATLLQKKLIDDMYENRSTQVPHNTKQDRIVTTILDNLSLPTGEK